MKVMSALIVKMGLWSIHKLWIASVTLNLRALAVQKEY